MKKDNLVTIGMIAERTGTTVSAIRFYADKGLLPSSRNAGGQRIFSKSVIRRVSFILISQQLGYSLADIEIALNSLPDNRTPTKADWNRLSQLFCDDIDQRILKLQKLKSSLSGCIGCGCLSLQVCQLYNPDDKISRMGSGPRFLLGDSVHNN